MRPRPIRIMSIGKRFVAGTESFMGVGHKRQIRCRMPLLPTAHGVLGTGDCMRGQALSAVSRPTLSKLAVAIR